LSGCLGYLKASGNVFRFAKGLKGRRGDGIEGLEGRKDEEKGESGPKPNLYKGPKYRLAPLIMSL